MVPPDFCHGTARGCPRSRTRVASDRSECRVAILALRSAGTQRLYVRFPRARSPSAPSNSVRPIPCNSGRPMAFRESTGDRCSPPLSDRLVSAPKRRRLHSASCTRCSEPWKAIHMDLTSFGGSISSIGTAAKDPLFFLLHCNVDRLWAKWQRLNGRFDPAVAASYDSNPANPIGHHLDDTMWPWNGITTPPRPPTAPEVRWPRHPVSVRRVLNHGCGRAWITKARLTRCHVRDSTMTMCDSPNVSLRGLDA